MEKERENIVDAMLEKRKLAYGEQARDEGFINREKDLTVILGETVAKLAHEKELLLTACESAVYNFERHKASGNFLGDDDYEAWQALDEAIRKARGE